MNKALLATLCLATALLSACATPPPAAAGDEAPLRAALAASAAAWNAGDLAGHLAIYDPSVTAMTRNGPRAGVAPIETAFRAAYFNGSQPKQQLDMSQVSIRFLSAGSALMTGRFALSGGGLSEQSGWFSLVWLQTPAGWRVVHDHSS
jgi:ketosteroid isomerase-like protein